MAARQSLNDYVVEQIRNKILDKTYVPGCRLPNEFQLAEEYSVCRYTIREAIKKLTATGLVEVKRGKGTFVKEMLPSVYLKSMIDVIILDDQSVREIFEARIAIEQQTAYLAAQNASEQDVAALGAIIDSMDDAIAANNLALYNELDIQFHYEIARVGKNKILCKVLEILHDMIRHAINQSAIKASSRDNSQEGHWDILKRIEDHAPELASNKMVAHLDHCLVLFKTEERKRAVRAQLLTTER